MTAEGVWASRRAHRLTALAFILRGSPCGLAPQDDVGVCLGLPARRLAKALIESQSPRISPSFFARLQPLICRSAAIASVMRSKYSDHANCTGRRVDVYPR